MDPAEQIASLESRVLELTARLDQIDNKDNIGFFEIPQEDFDPSIPLAQEIQVISATQSAKRTDMVVSWSNPDPGRIARFELWAVNVTGQNKEPYQVAAVDNAPASFSLEADQDTSVAIHIRTITRDGLSSTLAGSPTVGASIVQVPLGASDIADGSIGDAKLDRTSDPISIDTADIAAAAIGTAEIQNAAITNALIGNLAVDTAQIAAAAITDAKVNDLAAGKITAGNLAAGVAVLGTVLAGQIQAGTMTSVNVSAGTYTLTSGNEVMEIDGTNGFRQRNTSTANFTRILSGNLTLGTGSSFDAVKIQLATDGGEVSVSNFGFESGRLFIGSGGEAELELTNQSGTAVATLNNTDLGQTNSGYLAINNSSGTNRVELGVNSSGDGEIHINGTQVVGPQGATISDPAGGSTIDTEARTAIDAIIDRLQAHGLIA